MGAYHDLLLDEAIAAAKAWDHAEVGARHLLWALLLVLRDAAPADVPRDAVRALLAPRGKATAVPVVPDAVAKRLDGIEDKDAAAALATALWAELSAPPAAGSGSTDGAAATGDASGGTEAGGAADGGSGAAGASSAGGTATATATASATADTPGATTAPGKDTVESLLAELDTLVGLATAKAGVRRLIAVQRVNAERKAQGLPVVNASLHVVFTGPPGTGKTTVARLIARLYGAIGVVSKGHLVEASRPDLVAGYVGQTALKVQAVVEKALGGVLFIDEAYALAAEDAADFGEEAIATLVKLMEDHRNDLAVIVAGYPDEMRTFIDSNPGLRSRFTHYVEFPSYTTAELVQVFESIAATAAVDLAPDVAPAVARLVEAARGHENFGNARYVRSLFELAYANMAQRAVADGAIEPAEIRTLVAADLPPGDAWDAPRHIGFRHP